MFKQPIVRCFECPTDNNHENCDINNYIIINLINTDLGNVDENVKDSTIDKNFTFFGRFYSNSVWFNDIKNIYSLARKDLLKLEQAAIKGNTLYQSTDFSEVRKYICELMSTTRCVIDRYSNSENISLSHVVTLFKNLLKIVKRLENLPDYILFHSNKQKDNLVHHAAYNLLHLYLDIYWMVLTFEYQLENDNVLRLEIFEKNINILLTDLIYMAVRKFDKINIAQDPFKQTPFACSCFKEIWLLVQLYVEKLHSDNFCKPFWYYFNTTIENTLKLQNSNDNKNSLRCLWLLYHVANIQGYNASATFIGPHNYRVVSNYTLMDQCLRNIITGNEQINEQLLCTFLHLLASLQITWWPKDSTLDLIQLLWEYFYKRLNNLSSHPQDATKIVNNIKSYNFIASTELILHYDINAISSSVTSYELFLWLLWKHLKCNPTHWQKFKGRIYSKLPVQKLASFTESGLYNLVQLFFVLANAVNFTELTDRLQSLLIQLPSNRVEISVVVWCAYMSLIRMRCQRGMSLRETVSSTEICAPILQVVKAASTDRSRAHLMRIFIEELDCIIHEDSKLQCHQHMLFNNWLGRYLQWCSHSDVCCVLDLLLKLVERLRLTNANQDWWTTFEMYLVPSLIHLSGNTDTPYQVADLAASLVSLDKEQFKNLLEHMTGDTISVTLSSKFLKSLLEANRFHLESLADYQTVLIQAWIRIAMLNMDKVDLMEVTYLISQLPEYPKTIGSFDFTAAEDPLFTVIRIAGGRITNVQTIMESSALKRWCETYFGRMDRWVAPVLSAAERGENAPLVMRLYTSAALLFLHCAPALYIKNKNTCLLHRLTSNMLLPASILMNKKPLSIILSALRKTWHLFIRGFCLLDYKSDTYIERTLRDMVIRYVPHMYDSSSPIIRCMDVEIDETATWFILEKIANTFLTYRSKRPQDNAMQGLRLILEIFRAKCGNSSKTQILIKTVLPALLEHLLFTEDASMKLIILQTLQYIKSVDNNEIVRDAIACTIDKHLPFYSASTFALLETLTNVIPNAITNIVPYLKESVQKVEAMRGVGYDNSLRKGIQKVEDIINHH